MKNHTVLKEPKTEPNQQKRRIRGILDNIEEEGGLDKAEWFFNLLAGWSRRRRVANERASKKAIQKIKNHGTP